MLSLMMYLSFSILLYSNKYRVVILWRCYCRFTFLKTNQLTQDICHYYKGVYIVPKLMHFFLFPPDVRPTSHLGRDSGQPADPSSVTFQSTTGCSVNPGHVSHSGALHMTSSTNVGTSSNVQLSPEQSATWWPTANSATVMAATAASTAALIFRLSLLPSASPVILSHLPLPAPTQH